MKTTHAYAVLDVPRTVYAAVRALLAQADYQHAFHAEPDGEVIAPTASWPTWPRRSTMVFGAVVAIATLYDCVRIADLPDLLAGHQHAHGPWCWLLRDVVRIARPIAIRGAQGLWDLPPLAARELTAFIVE
jgi:hypothetical protein